MDGYNIGQVLFYLRKKYHIPVSAFEENCSQSTIAKLENGQLQFSIHMALQLFSKLGKSIECLEAVFEHRDFIQYKNLRDELNNRILKHTILSIQELEDMDGIFYFSVMRGLCEDLIRKGEWRSALEVCDQALKKDSYTKRIMDWSHLMEDKIFLLDKIGSMSYAEKRELKLELQHFNEVIERYTK